MVTVGSRYKTEDGTFFNYFKDVNFFNHFNMRLRVRRCACGKRVPVGKLETSAPRSREAEEGSDEWHHHHGNPSHISLVIIFIIITTAYDVKFETQVTHAVIVTNDIVGCARPARRRRRAGADDEEAGVVYQFNSIHQNKQSCACFFFPCFS